MQSTIDTISNSCLPVDILDQIHNLIDIGYQSYYDLDQELQISVLEAYLDDRGISIQDLKCDLDIKILCTSKTTLNNIVNQLFEPISNAYHKQVNDLFLSALENRQHPDEQYEDYLPNDYRNQ